MGDLHIKEGHSVGLFKFGMTLAEVERCNEIYIKECGVYKDSFFFEYDEDGRVTDIHLIVCWLKEHLQCNFHGIDVFNLQASELIDAFDAISPYIRDRESSEGYTYPFPGLGMTFWRGNVFTEQDLEADWFNELIPENQEDEKRFLFFETITFHHKEKVFHSRPETEPNMKNIPAQPTNEYWLKEPDPDRVKEIAVRLGLQIPIPKNLK